MKKSVYRASCAALTLSVIALIGSMGAPTEAQGRSGDRVVQIPDPPMRPDGLDPQVQILNAAYSSSGFSFKPESVDHTNNSTWYTCSGVALNTMWRSYR
jgi:hypothetical protein